MTPPSRRLAGLYTLGIGMAIIGLWGVLILGGDVPEIESTPFEIGFHLLAELLTGIFLILSGGGLLTHRSWAPRAFPIAIGMLLYTVINSAGYYAGLGAFEIVAMFGVLIATTSWLVGSLLTNPDGEPLQTNRDDPAVPDA